MPSPIVDTHAHLAESVFDPDRAAVLERARGSGVAVVVVVAEDLADAERALELARQHPMLRPAAGLYPGRLDPSQAEGLVGLIRERRDELVAIGEVGLDHWLAKEEETREIQNRIFGRLVDLALELDLPLNVHSRSAGRQVIQLLRDRGARRVQLHAFDGRASTAQPALEAGYFFSIPPSVLRSEQKQRLVRHLPLDCLLLESDSPVLGPTPGERNEPANVPIAARALAELKGVSVEELLDAVLRNTRRLYGEEICRLDG